LTVKDNNGCGSLPATDILLVGPTPIVNAGPDKLIQTGTSTTLDAAVTPAGNYTYLWSPGLYLNSASVLKPISTPLVTTTYLLRAEDPLSKCWGSDSVNVQVISRLFIPNAFTPNGDGLNDAWNIPGMPLYPDAVVTILNRYGQKIFESANYSSNAWNGTFKGAKQPNGVYIYIIQLNDTQKQILKGTINLIR
jgi:gliding motility-associated-like protein